MASFSYIPPFFIVGSPRSGTTLLRFILSSHPRLYVPDETGFIPYLVGAAQRTTPLTLDETARVLQKIGRLNYQWQGMVADVSAFYHALPATTLACILHALFRQVIAPYGAARWGDKTPLYVRYLPALHEIFPEAKFIHVIRDGRDATLSAQKKWGQAQSWYMDNYYLLQNWVTNVQIGQRDGSRLPAGQYLEVRYETLVAEPEQVVPQICAFLGETFMPDMLDQAQLARQVGPGPDNHTEVMQPISTGSVARWRSQMALFDQKLAHQIAGPLLGQLGYEVPAPPPFTPAEHLQRAGLAARYALAESLRIFLYQTGLLTLNRNMRKR